MSVPVRSKSFHDPMADSRRRHHRIKLILAGSSIALVFCFVLWAICWSPFLAVTNIQVTGALSIGNDTITSLVQDLLDQKTLYVFQPRHSLFLLDSRAISSHILGTYPSIAEAKVVKEYPHSLVIHISERKAVGQWCRQGACQLFDAGGVRWGSTLPSVGPLLLLVQDERSAQDVPLELLRGILKAVDGLPELGLSVRKVTLPDAEPGGVHILLNKGYELYMDALGDVADQLSVLSVFLADKAKDPSFSPQYIDLRTPGRVYYK